MSEQTADTPEVEGGKKIPPLEWALNSENDFRDALPKMMRYRKLIPEHLAKLMGGRNLFSAFLSGKQAHIRADSFFDAVLAMGLEVVVRPPQTSKTQRRIEAVKAETLARRAERAKELAETLAEQAEEAAQAAKDAA